MNKFSTTLLTATMAGILSTSAIAADYNFKFQSSDPAGDKNFQVQELIDVISSVDKDLIDTNTIDNFIIGNVEELNLEQYNNYFDVIILADVLEHLINPKEVLEKVANYLNKGGEILISIPNFRHKSAIYKVFFTLLFNN